MNPKIFKVGSIDRLLVDYPKLAAAVSILIESARVNNDTKALTNWDQARKNDLK